MKNLRLLNNLIFQIFIITIYSFSVFATEPVDIWKSNTEITTQTLDLEEEIEKLKNKWPEQEKYDKKYEELRGKEVKQLIFDKFLKELK